MEKEREVSGFGLTALRPIYARSLFPPHLPPFIDQEGSRSGINFLPTESNYLGSTYVPNSLSYTTKNVWAGRAGPRALVHRLGLGMVFFMTPWSTKSIGLRKGVTRPCLRSILVVKKTSNLLYCFVLPSPWPPLSPQVTHTRELPDNVKVGSPYFAHGGILKLCKINEFWTCWTKLNSLRQFTFLVKVNASRCGRSCYNRFNPVGIHCPAIKVICILLLFSYCLLLFYLVLWLWPWHS